MGCFAEGHFVQKLYILPYYTTVLCTCSLCTISHYYIAEGTRAPGHVFVNVGTGNGEQKPAEMKCIECWKYVK